MDDRKRSRDDSDDVDLEVKRLRENLLETLDDDDAEFCTATQDLDSFMKSFEEEIAPSPSAGGDVVVLRSDSGESRPDLGYLLEASDDELGLPPSSSSSSGGVEGVLANELPRVDSDSSELGGEFWEIPDFDSFGYGFGVTDNGEYVALDGLFDYSDVGFGSGGVVPRTETLPAL